MISFKEFLLQDAAGINAYIDPLSGKKWRHANLADQLRHILADAKRNGYKSSELWVQFSDLPKLGIYPRARDKGTPLGIYAYPLEYVVQRKGSVPYAGDRSYLVVFRIKDKSKILSFRGTKKYIKPIRRNILANHNHFLKTIIFLEDKQEKINEIIEKFFQRVDSKLIGRTKNSFLYSVQSFYEEIRALKRYKRDTYGISTPSTDRSYFHSLENLIEKTRRDFSQKIDRSTYEMKEKLHDMAIFPGFDLRFDGEFNFTFESLRNTSSLRDSILRKFKDKERKRLGRKLLDKEILDLIVKAKEKANEGSTSKKYKKNEIPLELKKDPKVLEMLKTIRAIKIFEEKDLYKIKHFIDKTLDKLKEFVVSNKEQFESSLKIPSKLRDLCEKYGVNIEKLLSTFSLSYAGEASIYLITKFIAQDPKFIRQDRYGVNIPMKWTKLLMELGYEGVIDAKETGTIHPSEPSQGVFFTTSNLDVITIIENSADVIKTFKQETPLDTPLVFQNRKQGDYRSYTNNSRDRTSITLNIFMSKLHDFVSSYSYNPSFEINHAFYLYSMLLSVNKFISNNKINSANQLLVNRIVKAIKLIDPIMDKKIYQLTRHQTTQPDDSTKFVGYLNKIKHIINSLQKFEKETNSPAS